MNGIREWLDDHPFLSGFLFGLVVFGLVALVRHLVTGQGAL